MKNYYLYLIRHGITQGNLDGKYIGQTDLALCPEGKKQIETLCADEIYPEVDKVYSSPLTRCLETAEIIYPEQKLMIVDEICEMNFGEFEGKTQRQLQDLREYTDWLRGGSDAAPPSGERRLYDTLYRGSGHNFQRYDEERHYPSCLRHSRGSDNQSPLRLRLAQGTACGLYVRSRRGF